ncbi:protein of unknown function [Streptomyces sp. KY75]|nr:protein of unknown function [Streptomyces sp. KY70]CAD5972329.1 protein of unknown function [Streptomyces sp. KY75]
MKGGPCSGAHRNTARPLPSLGIRITSGWIRCDLGWRIHGDRPRRRAGTLRTVSRSRLVTVGLGLGAVGGFVGSLFHERNALAAARDAAGERSEGSPPWGVGLYRSPWTTFKISPSAAARASSGSLTRSAGKPR